MMGADQIAVVTGASSGIGRALALALAAQGATVCLIGRNVAALELVAASARQDGGRASCYPADLSSDEDVHQLVVQLRRDFDAVDILVHSAGVIAMGRMELAPVQEFDWQYRVNVRAPYVLTQALLPQIRARRGQVVFINSTVGVHARAGVGQYAATKHALKAVADSLREEINAEGVRVVSVYPGRTASPMQASIHAAEGRAYHPERLMQPEDVAAVVLNALLLPRSAEVTDMYVRPFQKAS